jgi:hypothetical protein
VTLKQQSSIWEGESEVVKRSGRDESVQVVIHLYMEAMLESLCIAILISISKNAMSLLLLRMSSLLQNWRKGTEQFLPGSEGVGVGGIGGGVGARNEPNNICTYE